MIAVRVSKLGKQYRRYDAERPWTLHEFLTGGFLRHRIVQRIWSLRNVSFEVEDGHALGVVGRNGAGKSTLLRLLSRVMIPDEGTVNVRGRIGGLLELTAGFHPDLTGRENTMIGGVLRGLTRSDVRQNFDSIVAFAELEDAIDRPLRTYSSGMQMRLAFSVVVHSRPDVLLVDEVLAVGDLAFQQKCLDRIRQLRSGGCSIVLVSHDPVLVESMCDSALWLSKGEVVEAGPAPNVVHKYAAAVSAAPASGAATDMVYKTTQGVVLRTGKNRFGDQDVEITDVRVCTTSDTSGLKLAPGDSLVVALDYVFNRNIPVALFSVTVIHDDGRVCFGSKTQQPASESTQDTNSGSITVRWQDIHLEPGVYFVEVGVYDENWTYAYDYHARSYPLVVRASSLNGLNIAVASGEFTLRPEWSVNAGKQQTDNASHN
jgi:lipopolysaccharide transport system ATP-binding protein